VANLPVKEEIFAVEIEACKVEREFIVILDMVPPVKGRIFCPE
jgi:hypothetical protein